jgi:hypothetical protein
MTMKLLSLGRIFLFALLLPPVSPAAIAQVTEATLKLSVADEQSNTVSGVSVEITNEDTGVKRAAVTDNNSQVTVAGLPSGSYAVSLKANGFKSFSQKNLKLNVGQMAELKIQLSVGAVEEVVNIDAGTAQLQIATEGRVADTLDQKKVSELPIPQRDVYALPKLSSGATFIPGAANSTKLTNSPVVTVNGNRYRGNNYVLDGAMNSNSNNSGEPAIVPSIESIEEAQVQTNNFSSEFGRGNGAVINLRTKSGTNQFHGRLWEFHRNAAINARNFFCD